MSFFKYFYKTIIVLLIPTILFIAFSVLTSGFGLHTLRIILSQSLIPMVLGFGMIFSMTAGLFDLSAGANMVMAAMLGAMLSQYFGVAGLFIGSIGGGVLIGLFISLLYRNLKIPSLVISLGIVLIIEILAIYSAGRTSFIKIPEEMARVASYPFSLIFSAVAALLFWIVYYRTPFSYQLQTIGSDEMIARNLGIKTMRIKMLSYIVGGFFFGVAALLQISYSGSISAQVNMTTLSIVFQPMMGVMIGMTLKKVFDNMVVNIFIGQIVISMIFNGFIALGMPDTLKNVFIGLLLLIVIGYDNNKTKIADYRRRRLIKSRLHNHL